MAISKILALSNNIRQWIATVLVSAGATDASKVPLTGSNGLLDNSLVNWAAPGAIGATSPGAIKGTTANFTDTTAATGTGTASAIFAGGIGCAKTIFLPSTSSASAVGIAFGAINNGLYSDVSGRVQIATGGTTRAFFDGNGCALTGSTSITLPQQFIANGNSYNAQFKVTGGTATASGTGVVGLNAFFSQFDAPTVSLNGGVGFTNAATLYIANAPTLSGGAAVTNNYALLVGGGKSKFNGLVLPPSYTVATLPTPSASTGAIAYASDGRKAGEGAGSGTGVLVYCDASQWRRASDDTTAVA